MSLIKYLCEVVNIKYTKDTINFAKKFNKINIANYLGTNLNKCEQNIQSTEIDVDIYKYTRILDIDFS